jgi:uncharacterized protein (TIGR00369 family)
MTADPPRLDLSPYQRFLGIRYERIEAEAVTIRLPFRAEFLRSDDSDWFHGGVVSALIDIAGDYAVALRTGQGVPTVDLRVDWLKPARAGDLLATGRVVKLGRTLSVADVEVHDTKGTLVAVGRGVYAMPSGLPRPATA